MRLDFGISVVRLSEVNSKPCRRDSLAAAFKLQTYRMLGMFLRTTYSGVMLGGAYGVVWDMWVFNRGVWTPGNVGPDPWRRAKAHLPKQVIGSAWLYLHVAEFLTR